MSSPAGEPLRTETGVVTLRYWAAARSAAGVDHDAVAVDGPVTLAELVRLAVAAHPDSRLGDILRICSVLVGDRPVSAEDPGEVIVEPGDRVEFLPPFAGG